MARAIRAGSGLAVTAVGLLLSTRRSTVERLLVTLLRLYKDELDSKGLDLQTFTLGDSVRLGAVAGDEDCGLVLIAMRVFRIVRPNPPRTRPAPDAPFNPPADVVDFRPFHNMDDLLARLRAHESRDTFNSAFADAQQEEQQVDLLNISLRLSADEMRCTSARGMGCPPGPTRTRPSATSGSILSLGAPTWDGGVEFIWELASEAR